MFKIHSKFKPRGDQPQVIEKLTKNLKSGAKNQVLLGVTGSRKSVVKNTPVVIKKAAQNLDFERAAEIRDLIKKLND